MAFSREAWAVLIAAFLINTFEGIIYCFGVMFPDLLHTFGYSRATTAWVGSTMACCLSLVGPLASIMIVRLGTRVSTILGSLMVSCGLLGAAFAPNIYVLILTQGILAGSGLGINCISSFVAVGRAFNRGRCVATAVTSCGSGVGTLVLAPFMTWLIGIYGWRGTLCLLAAFYVPYTYLPSYSIENTGASPQKAALLLSLVGGANIVGRLVLGTLCELSCSPSKIYSCALMCGGLATLGWGLLPHSYTAHALCAVVFGLTAGASFGVTSLLLIQVLGLKHLATTFGLLNLVRGLATLGGIPLAGLLMDLIGRVDISFYLSAVAILTSGVVTLPLICLTRVKTKEKDSSDEETNLEVTVQRDVDFETCILFAGSHNSLMYVNSMTNLSREPTKDLFSSRDLQPRDLLRANKKPVFTSSDNLYVSALTASLRTERKNSSIGQMIHNVHL